MTASPRRALVTGGAGFIGSHLVAELVERDLQVVVLDNLSTGLAERVDPRATLVNGDIRDPQAVEYAIKDVDLLFHMAARVTIRGSIEHFYEDVDHNVMGTLNLLRSVPQGLAHFILASSMAVYAPPTGPEALEEDALCEPISPYGVSKLAAERLAAQVLAMLGVPFTALRYFNTYGPHQRFSPYVGVVTIFATTLLQGGVPTVFGDGEQQRDFVHVDDIVAGTVAALEGPPGVYNLGTGRATSVNELARLISEHLGIATQPRHGPENRAEPRFAVADIGAARRHLGYEPRGRLEVDLAEVIAAIARDLPDG